MQVGTTFSIFNDVEKSNDNIFASGLLDFELTVSPFSNNAWTNLTPGTTTDQDVDVVPHDLSNPFVYFASSTNFTGDDDFCDVINVVAVLDGDIVYDGFLTEMLTGTTTILDTWNLEFSTETSFFNSVCHFEIDWNGWQTRHGYPNYNDGFSDTETTAHWLFADGLKINKVYFEVDELVCRMDNHSDNFLDENDQERDGDGRQERRERWPHPDRDCYDGRGRDSGESDSNASSTAATSTFPTGEWVELYNPNEEAADIDGWFLCDGDSCDELNVSDPIPPFGYAIVVGEISDLTGWVTPSDFVIITIDDGEIGNGLDNENDALFLRRPDFLTFDQVNWGIPDPTWPYFVPELWNPGIASTTDGTMIARVPTGFDTNQLTDFKVLYIPQIYLLYPGNVVNNKWFWGFIYLVTWEAFNPNGDDSELLIDIYMIRDSNYSGQIDEGDEHILLKDNIENDGNEEVTVPEGFLGNIWIKIIVTGPENPMTHGFDISGIIDDPIPQFMFEDEESRQIIEGAIVKEIQATGRSDYSTFLIEPVIASSTPMLASTTPDISSTTPDLIEVESASTTSESLIEDGNASSTEEILEDHSASSSEPISEEGDTNTTTENLEEEPIENEESGAVATSTEEITFKEEVAELIDEAIEEIVNEALLNTEPEENESEEQSSEEMGANDEAIIEEEQLGIIEQ